MPLLCEWVEVWSRAHRSSQVWSPPWFFLPECRQTTTCTVLLSGETRLNKRFFSSRSSTCAASPTETEVRRDGWSAAGTSPLKNRSWCVRAPCLKAWAWSPWWSQTCRVHSSGCLKTWSTGWDRPDGQSSGSPCSGKALSAGTRHPPHSGKSWTQTKLTKSANGVRKWSDQKLPFLRKKRWN